MNVSPAAKRTPRPGTTAVTMHQATRASIAARRSRPCTCNCSGRPGNNGNAAPTHAPTADTFINCTSCPGFTRHTIDSIRAWTSCLGTARRSPLTAPPTPARANRTPTTEPAPSAHTPAPRTARRSTQIDRPRRPTPRRPKRQQPRRAHPNRPFPIVHLTPITGRRRAIVFSDTRDVRRTREPHAAKAVVQSNNRPQRRIDPRRNFTRPHPIAIAIGIRTKARGVSTLRRSGDRRARNAGVLRDAFDGRAW